MRRNCTLLAVLAGLCLAAAARAEDELPPAPEGKTWQLVWHDEFDIMEKPWLDERVQQTLHWDGYREQHKSQGNVARVPGVMEGWHTFSIWWDRDQYVFYVDGHETWRTDAGGVCQVPLYIKLSDEIGNWAGDIRQAKLPDRFLVDYVRVYDLVEGK